MSADAVWRPVPGYEWYDVTDDGQVRSWYGMRRPAVGRATSPKQLKPQPHYKGHLYVNLYVDGKPEHRFVHFLVLLAFVGPRPPGAVVRHLDGDHLNNDLTNLAYGTVSDNVRDAVRHGTSFQTAKTHCKHGHEFTPENTWTYSGRPRVCRTCQNEKVRKRREAAERPWPNPCVVCGAEPFARCVRLTSGRTTIAHARRVKGEWPEVPALDAERRHGADLEERLLRHTPTWEVEA